MNHWLFTMVTATLGLAVCLFLLSGLDLRPIPSVPVPVAWSGAPLDVPTTRLTISPDGLVVDGIPVMGLQDFGLQDFAAHRDDVSARSPELLLRLYEHLLEKAECSKCLAGHHEEEFHGRIHIYADPDTPAALLKRVLYTCQQAQFLDVGFVVRG